MKYLQNLHTHSVYCDGKNTPEELVEKALSLGFDTLGFSIHAYMWYSENMSKWGDKTPQYIEEIKRLKEVYKDKIKLLLGIELDMYAPVDLSQYEYLIGSMHYFKFGDKHVAFDRNAETVQGIIDNYFDGDGMKFARRYYEEVVTMHDIIKRKIDVIGHIDIILKTNNTLHFVDTSSKEYQGYAIEAVRELAKKTDIFEMNTGAIARGYRPNPYPEDFIIKEINRLGKGIIITSDCHNKDYLNCYFDESLEILKANGVGEVYTYKDGKFVPNPLY